MRYLRYLNKMKVNTASLLCQYRYQSTSKYLKEWSDLCIPSFSSILLEPVTAGINILDMFVFNVIYYTLIRAATYHLSQAAVTGSSTPCVWWGWAGLWTGCGTVYIQRWCPPPSAACVSADWYLRDRDKQRWLSGPYTVYLQNILKYHSTPDDNPDDTKKP